MYCAWKKDISVFYLMVYTRRLTPDCALRSVLDISRNDKSEIVLGTVISSEKGFIL